MRYPDGGLTAQGRLRREQVRLQAAEMFAHDVDAGQVARSLRVWLWTVDITEPGTGPVQDWWPGDSYVTWVGIDGYYYQSDYTFANAFLPTIAEVQDLHPAPDTAVGDRGRPSRAARPHSGGSCRRITTREEPERPRWLVAD